MSKISNILMAGALAVASVAPSLASAGPVMHQPLKVEKPSDVTDVRCERCRFNRNFNGDSSMRTMTRSEARGDQSRYYRSDSRWRRYSYRDYGRRDRFYRPRHYYGSAFWGPGLVLAPSIVLGPRVIVRRSNYASAHVRWCERRYVSYSARTNTFMSNNGYRKQCNSPYR